MLSAFFALAAQSPGRQRAFRAAVVSHLVVLACGAAAAAGQRSAPLLGHLLLVLGVVEGAVLVGWRLAQLPKSQALEFLLVSPLQPHWAFAAEALVGLARLALVTLAGLPLLLLLAQGGLIDTRDVGPLLAMPWTWGAATGLGLTAWSYEPRTVRRWGERVVLAGLVVYLGVGVMAGERLRDWAAWLPGDLGHWCLNGFEAMHRYNPFAVLEYWLTEDPVLAGDRLVGLEVTGLGLVAVLLCRAAGRLKGHFQERHYRPVVDEAGRRRGAVGDRPLAWWAVRRVTEYSGRINLWLAGGFGSLYALYTLAGPAWPPWLGRAVFATFDRAGGIPMLAAALVVLAAVPAAFQYGLWDSNAQDRCRRLELLLLTRLGARDYWDAAAAAAWRRGRGYFAIAALQWTAATLAGRMAPVQWAAALAAGTVCWGLYFAVGFRAFSRGLHANGLGLLLTLGLPLLAYACHRAGWTLGCATLPPGSVYGPATDLASWLWLPGPLVGGMAALGLARRSQARCDGELRSWYDRNHGRKVLE